MSEIELGCTLTVWGARERGGGGAGRLAFRKPAVQRDPAQREKNWSERGPALCQLRGRLPGGLKGHCRGPAAGSLDRDTADETRVQRGGMIPGTAKSLATGSKIRNGG